MDGEAGALSSGSSSIVRAYMASALSAVVREIRFKNQARPATCKRFSNTTAAPRTKRTESDWRIRAFFVIEGSGRGRAFPWRAPDTAHRACSRAKGWPEAGM